jgi:hypothetical protein
MPNSNTLQCSTEREYSDPLDPKEPKEPNARLYYPSSCSQSDTDVHLEARAGFTDGIIADGSLSLAKLADLPANTIIGSVAGGTPDALTPVQGVNLLNSDSSFDTQVRTNKLNEMSAPDDSLDLNNQKITNLADPTADGDAVNKKHFESIPNANLLSSYNSRALTLGQSDFEFKKLKLKEGLEDVLRVDKRQPAYYLNGDRAIFDGLTTNFIGSGTSNINGTFDGSSPTFANLTNEINGIKGFRNVETTLGAGYNNTNFFMNGFDQAFTVSFWLYFNSSAGVQRLLSFNVPLEARFELLSSGSEIRGRAMTDLNDYIGRAKTDFLSNANFYKITMVYEKNLDTSADVKLYGNGVQIDDADSVSGAFTGIPATSTSTVEIGSYLNGENSSHSTIFEVEILPGYARSAGDELRLFNEQKSQFGL